VATAEATKLLIVEDDAIAREGIGAVLRRADYETILVANGQEALACLESGTRPDLVILDMLMPVLDGWQFLANLRGLPLPAVPIIVISSIGLSDEWARDHGCCSFVKKPIDPETLVEKVNRCLNGRCQPNLSPSDPIPHYGQ
jgi:CheY-like chemotaxis protein